MSPRPRVESATPLASARQVVWVEPGLSRSIQAYMTDRGITNVSQAIMELCKIALGMDLEQVVLADQKQAKLKDLGKWLAKRVAQALKEIAAELEEFWDTTT